MAIGRSDMSDVLFLVEEAPEGGFTARALGDSIFTAHGKDSNVAMQDLTLSLRDNHTTIALPRGVSA